MILTTGQILQFIKEPSSKELIEKACESHKKLDMHVNGNNVIEYIREISNFENSDQLVLRKNTSISNKHLFSSIIRVINKVFSAKGGSTYYELTDTKQDEFRNLLKDVKGVPIRKWIQNKALNKYLTDPNGVILIENKEGKEGLICYPTYKSINTIHDYQRNGRKLEYVIFKLPKTDDAEWFRVYDDAKDYMVKLINDHIEIIEELNGIPQTFDNVWGRVPGFVIGDLFHDNLDLYESRFSIAAELADKYLRTNSVKNVYEFAHGFPIMWKMLTAKCKTCDGTGLIEGHVCRECKGTGYYIKKDVSDVIGIVPPTTNDEPKLVPDIAGYVQPDLETWREFRTELEWLEKLIQYSILGSYTREKADNETATGAFIDSQPVNDTLNDYADWVEETEKYITDFIGEFHYQGTYKGSSINLGRRYMIEKTDDLWKRYESARISGAPTEWLDDALIEYYESKYANDSKTLSIQKKLFYTNDYRHLTIAEAKTSLPLKEYLKRAFYDAWLITLSEEVILKLDYQKLHDNFLQFVETKIKENATNLSGAESGQTGQGSVSDTQGVN